MAQALSGAALLREKAVAASRALAAVACAGLAAAAAASHAAWRRDKATVDSRVAAAGLAARQPELATRIAREPDAVRSGLALGRALFAEALDRRSVARLPLEEAVREIEREGEKLAAARELAAAAWSKRPAAGEAAMVLGGATYLAAARGLEQPAQVPAGDWRRALLLARSLAPAEREPVRLLAVAALERWPALDEVDRSKELALLREAFADPATLTTLVGPWLRIAGDTRTAFAAVPDLAAAWETMAQACGRRALWDGFCEARGRQRAALRHELEAALEDARRRLAGGDPRNARAACWQVVRSAPPDLEFAPLAAAALEISPAGPVEPHTAAAARAWLEWALEGSVRGRERLPRGAIGRLLVAAGTLPPPLAALGALAAGDLQRAELLERRSEALNLEEWAPYCLAKARALAGRGEAEGALAILSSVHRAWRGTPVHAEVRLAVARAAAGGVAEAERVLADLAASQWPATTWRWHGGVAALDFLLDEPAAGGLLVVIDGASPAGSVAAFRLDGGVVALRPVASGDRVRLEGAVDRGVHMLEVETAAGGRVLPGDVAVSRGQGAGGAGAHGSGVPAPVPRES